jgi:hypothetical protein
MSKKFIFLLTLFLIIMLACGASIFIINNPSLLMQNQTVKNFFNQNATDQTQVTTNLSLGPLNTQAVPGKTQTISITLTSSANAKDTPRLVQLEIGYDPMILTNVSLKPGSYFSNPTVLLSNIDTHTGRISYAIEENTTNSTIQPSGTVAFLEFTPLAGFTQTTIALLPKTMVRAKTETNILTTKTGTTLQFTNGLDQATTSARGL